MLLTLSFSLVKVCFPLFFFIRNRSEDGIESGLSLKSATFPQLCQFFPQVAFCLQIFTLFRDEQMCCSCFLQRFIENCGEDPSAASQSAVMFGSSFLSSTGTCLEGCADHMELIIYSCCEKQCTQ